MPRRSPATVRRDETRRHPSVRPPRSLPPPVVGVLLRWERERGLFPGETLDWLAEWTGVASRPRRWAGQEPGTSCGGPGCCDPSPAREQLERLLQSLPRRPSRTLRRIVLDLDDRILRHPVVVASGHAAWWQDETAW